MEGRDFLEFHWTEEARLASMTGMFACARRPGETTNAFLARCELARQRAAIEGQFVMGAEGCALHLSRACSGQLMLLIEPFGGMMPTSGAQFHQLVQQLRRQGHVAEGVCGNITTVLQGPLRRARPHA